MTTLPDDDAPRRLIKAWLPIDLVRGMDTAILGSEGSFVDRTDFIAEALTNLLSELRHESPAPSSSDSYYQNGTNATTTEDVSFGDWLDRNPVTMPASDGPETNFGMHNRDWPTLWAIDWLGRLATDAGEPVSWDALVAAIVPRAWREAQRLRARSDGFGIKAEAGFPTQMKRRESGERRFLAHSVGTLNCDGPAFVFRLIGLDQGRVAPSPAALDLLTQLRSAGVETAPPFSPVAWQAFKSHLNKHARPEIEMWTRVLEVIAGRPNRTELGLRCPWWEGGSTETNANSYVARGREWGLVEPRLIEGRYQLTELGEETVEASIAEIEPEQEAES